MNHPIRFLLACLLWPLASTAQPQPFDMQPQTLPNPDNEPACVFPVPSRRQLSWQQTEFYAFFHYGMNTYTNREWGLGSEDERLFAPTLPPDTKQWLRAVKAAGMKGGIAVVKHHDGFCLWPTQTTTHSVARAGNDNGRQTNIPRDFARAARQLHMKYGFYVSPWDRNNLHYGTDRYVNDVFLRQCAELAHYGSDQFEMWFDGANGGDGYYGGRNTTLTVDRATYYDIPNLRDSIHHVCPDIILWGVGAEARWIGNEEGWAGETNWAAEEVGYAPENNGMYGTEDGWAWEAGESDAKLTDRGWFWHEGEKPLSAERLFQMYLETVGRNATLILNCPPGRDGRLPEADVDTLARMGQLLRQRLGRDLARKAVITASNIRQAGRHRNYALSHLTDGKTTTYWATDDSVSHATVTLAWSRPQTVRYVDLMEHIARGQRVRAFHIDVSTDGQTWQRVARDCQTTTVGYRRIIPLNGSTAHSYGPGITVRALRIVIDDCKSCPLLQKVAVY